jgi:hypothetical protein
MGEWRKLHNEELRDLYSSPGLIRMIKSVKEDEIGRACSANGRKEKDIRRILMGKLKGKRSVGGPSSMWTQCIKMNLREIGLVVWTEVIWFMIGTRRRLLWMR